MPDAQGFWLLLTDEIRCEGQCITIGSYSSHEDPPAPFFLMHVQTCPIPLHSWYTNIKTRELIFYLLPFTHPAQVKYQLYGLDISVPGMQG